MAPSGPSPAAPVVVPAPGGGRLVVHAFPNDTRFVRDIQRSLDLAEGGVQNDGELIRRALTTLRSWYPSIQLRARDDLAGLSTNERVWYAFRDGAVGRRRERIDRMHAVLSDARATTDDSQRALDKAREALNAARQPRGRPDGAATPAPDATRAGGGSRR